MPFDSASYTNTRMAGVNALATGITSAADTIAQRINQSKVEGRQLKAMHSMLVDVFEIPKEEADKLSLEDARAFMEGQVLKQHRQKQKQQQDFSRQMMEMMGPPIQDPPASGMIMEDGSMAAPPQTAAQPAFDPRQFMQAAAQTGTLTPELAFKFIQEGQGVNWDELQPREFTTSTGLRGVYGKGGQFQFDPTQFMTPTGSDGSITPIPVKDPETGEVIGYRVPTGRGGTQAAGKPKEPVQLPSTFQSKVDELEQQLREADAALSLTDDEIAQRLPAFKKPEQIAAFKAREQARREQTVQNARSLFSRYQSEGYGKPETWEQLHQTFGVAEKSGKRESGKAETAERVIVQDKAGNKFTLPASQVEAGKAKGYTPVK